MQPDSSAHPSGYSIACTSRVSAALLYSTPSSAFARCHSWRHPQPHTGWEAKTCLGLGHPLQRPLRQHGKYDQQQTNATDQTHITINQSVQATTNSFCALP
jgi:hypothetical protein